MARWQLLNRPWVATFKAETLTYTVQLIFDVQVVSPDLRLPELSRLGSGLYDEAALEASDFAQPPAAVRLTHYGTNNWGEAYNTDVNCFMAHRRLENEEDADGLRCVITYQGRVEGTHAISNRVQMLSEPLIHSLEASPDGTFARIGANFEGTPRDVPMIIYSLDYVIGLVDITGHRTISEDVSGMVSEANWQPPWHFHATRMEGEFLYLGITRSSIDKRTRTARLTHEFARIAELFPTPEHLHSWRDFHQVKDPVTGGLTRAYANALSTAKKAGIAGTDSAFQFGDLFLAGTDDVRY